MVLELLSETYCSKFWLVRQQYQFLVPQESLVKKKNVIINNLMLTVNYVLYIS